MSNFLANVSLNADARSMTQEELDFIKNRLVVALQNSKSVAKKKKAGSAKKQDFLNKKGLDAKRSKKMVWIMEWLRLFLKTQTVIFIHYGLDDGTSSSKGKKASTTVFSRSVLSSDAGAFNGKN